MNLKTRDLTLIAMFSALTAIGAFIKIPLPIVPITLQYFFCALGALLLGAKKGALAQVLYVAVGMIGIPVFTKGGGPQYVLEPSFGYLIGFIAGAYVIGKCSENIKILTVKNVFTSCLLGLLIVYIFGCAHMYVLFNFYIGKAMNAWSIVKIGILAFIGSDLLATLMISIVAVRVVPLLRKLGYAV